MSFLDQKAKAAQNNIVLGSEKKILYRGKEDNKTEVLMKKEIRGEKRREIFEIIKKAEKISLREIKALTGINYNTVRSAVIGLTRAGLIERVDRGVYKLK